MNLKLVEIKQILAENYLFQSLAETQQKSLAEIAKFQKYQKGEILFTEDSPNLGFFLIISGKVKVFKISPHGKEQILHFFSSGEHFAEVCAFDGQPFPAAAKALEATEVLFFPRPAFIKLLENNPELALALLAVFATHLRRFVSLIEDLSLKEVPGRLAHYLLKLSTIQGNATEIELELTKTQLAAFLGTIPQTLSRVFAKLVAEKIIGINQSKISLLNREKLAQISTGSFSVDKN